MIRVAVFASGTGTNCENLIRYFNGGSLAEIVVVLSNRSQAPVLERSRALGVEALYLPKAGFENGEVLDILKERNIDFVVLAGFLLTVSDSLIEAYPRKIVNIHPALLPKYGGKGMYGHFVHEAVKEAGDRVSGLTVHYVNDVVDGGEIIAQRSFPVTPEDSAEDIAAKEHVLEMEHFPLILEDLFKSL